MENNKSLEIFLAKNRDLFYYPDFNLEDTLTITNKNISQFIQPPMELSDTENELSLIHSNIEIFLPYLTKVKHKS